MIFIKSLFVGNVVDGTIDLTLENLANPDVFLFVFSSLILEHTVSI